MNVTINKTHIDREKIVDDATNYQNNVSRRFCFTKGAEQCLEASNMKLHC